GRIGAAVARRARGFDMRVLSTTSAQGSLDELLAESDFVSIHCPLTDATRGLIGARQLDRMKPTAILINTARGPIVDEAALIAALAAGRPGAAGLDVFADEPRVPEALRLSPRVVLAPHIGSATRATRARMGELCALGVNEVLAGRRPPN